MAVKKLGGAPLAKHPIAKRTVKMSKEKVDIASLRLPDTEKELDQDFSKFVTLFYGTAGIGKTTLAASFPNTIFAGFEPGQKALSTPEFFSQNKIQPSWEAFRAMVDMLVETPPAHRKYQTVAIDIVDQAYECAMKWVCNELGISYISEDRTGKSDRSGKGWTTLRQEFKEQLYRLSHAGYGLVLTSHSKTKEIESHSGATYDVIVPTMGGQALDVIRSITDFILYAEYVRDSKGNSIRVLITTGDELVMAKHRTPLNGAKMPRYIEIPDPSSDPNAGYKRLTDAYSGLYHGLEPGTFLPSKQTSKVGARSIIEQKTRQEADGRSAKTAAAVGKVHKVTKVAKKTR